MMMERKAAMKNAPCPKKGGVVQDFDRRLTSIKNTQMLSMASVCYMMNINFVNKNIHSIQ